MRSEIAQTTRGPAAAVSAENSPPDAVPAQFDFLPDGEPSLTIGGLALDPDDSALQGCYINDSGNGRMSAAARRGGAHVLP